MIKVVLIDDEKHCTSTLQFQLEQEDDIEIIHIINDPREAKKVLETSSIDLVFLDIEMPLINGFDLLDGLKTKPQIIFITSKADYAVKAFDYEATDFLQKPISKERFNKAVKKATEMHALRYENHEDQGESIVIKSN